MVRSKVDKGISTDLCTERDRIVLPRLPQYRHVRVALSLSSLAMPPRRLITLVWYLKPCVLGFSFPAPSEQPMPHIQQCQCCLKSSLTGNSGKDHWLQESSPSLTTSVESHFSMSSMKLAWGTGTWDRRKECDEAKKREDVPGNALCKKIKSPNQKLTHSPHHSVSSGPSKSSQCHCKALPPTSATAHLLPLPHPHPDTHSFQHTCH